MNAAGRSEMWYVVSGTCRIFSGSVLMYKMLLSVLSPTGPPSLPFLQDGRSLLHAAVHSGNMGLVQWFVEHHYPAPTVTKVSF